MNFLVLIIDPNLTRNAHAEFVAKQMAKGLFLLRRLIDTVDISIILNVYYAIIYFDRCVNFTLAVCLLYSLPRSHK